MLKMKATPIPRYIASEVTVSAPSLSPFSSAALTFFYSIPLRTVVATIMIQ